MSAFVELKKEIRDASYYCDDFACNLRGSGGYICDEISNFADRCTSIYYSDIDRFAEDHPNELRDAVLEGLAMKGREYFSANPNDDYLDYTRYLSQCAEYMTIENDLYGNIDTMLLFCAWYEIDGRDLSEDEKCDCFAAIRGEVVILDNNDMIDDICDMVDEWIEENTGESESEECAV